MSSYKGIGRNRSVNSFKTASSSTPKKSFEDDVLIPHAPVGTRGVSHKELDRWRSLLNEEYPIMSPTEIAKAGQSLYTLLIHQLMSSGRTSIAHELVNLVKEEESERINGRHQKLLMNTPPLKQSHEKLKMIVDTLKSCNKFLSQGHYEDALMTRKQLAEDFMNNGDVFLARHFLLSCLSVSKRLKDEVDVHEDIFNKMQAETHCLLAFLSRESNENLESVLAQAVDHLAIAREISKNKRWQFKPKVLLIRLKRPIGILGLHAEENHSHDDPRYYDIVDGCSLPVYMIATLLEHEMLITLSNKLMHNHHHVSPTMADVEVAHEFANHALKLALEVRHPTAMSSAFMRFGLVLRQSGAFEDALKYFEQLLRHSITIGDYITEAIALQNIGLCLMGSHKPTPALEYFAKQLDICKNYNIKDVEALALHEIGHMLLQEGFCVEAEECYTLASENYHEIGISGNHETCAWAMLGVAAGHKLWPRFGNICRKGRDKEVVSILDWKFSRTFLQPVRHHRYKCQLIANAFSKIMAKTSPLIDDYDSIMDYEILAEKMELVHEKYTQSDQESLLGLEEGVRRGQQQSDATQTPDIRQTGPR